jgi:hypothetical protein
MNARLCVVVIFLGSSTFPVFAHHSESGFDHDAVVAFEGTVTEYSWRNPHVYINVATVDAAGNVVEWIVETGATPILQRSGWTRDSVQVGETISVRGHPERGTDRNYTLLLSLEKEDGSTLAQNSGDLSGDAQATSLAGVWKGRSGLIEPFFRQLGEVPLTEQGSAAKADYNFYLDSPAANCIGPTVPTILALGLYVNEIVLGDEQVQIRSEFFDSDRVVYMDGRGHPADGERTNQGHSIGRWEDEALVVDTVLFSDHRSGNGNGVPSGSQKHTVERYSLADDGTHIIIDLFLEDPEYLAEPFEGRLEWNYVPQLELYRYDCDPEVSRRFRLD